MRNIFLLPTDNYSPLVHSTSRYGGLFLSKYYSPTKEMGDCYLNIYITSSEEIKEGVNQWYLDKFLNKPRNSSGSQYGEKQDVIILTTDPKLIVDGVQSIDDEFLQWFVKNPSCEEVEVIKEFIWPLELGHWAAHNEYKIMIPKEEPKLTNNCPKCGLDLIEREGSKPVCKRIDCSGIILSNETLKEWAITKTITKEHPKQETIEEAAERIVPFVQEIFIKGAKWQQEKSQSIVPSDAYNIEVFAIKPDEQGNLFAYIGYKITNGDFYFNVVPFTEPQQQRMYSEEEVIEILKDFRGNILPNVYTVDWFEQFKKK